MPILHNRARQPLFAAILLLAVCASPAAADPIYIFGMHDPGGEQHAVDMGKRAWIVFTEAIGSNPADHSGRDYRPWTVAGHGVIARLNNGYGSSGTIPHDSDYANFAQRCANYIANSQGCRYWIIGNETNLPREWPGNDNGDPTTGQPITVARYVNCYNQCYDAVKAVRPTARLIPAPSGTWAPPYPDQGIEGFLDYWVNILNTIGADRVDALAIHTYTHGCDPALIFDESKMQPPYQDIYYNFRAYKNYMNALPAWSRDLPVFITESDQNTECADPPPEPRHTWHNANNGWVKNAYQEINAWNSANSHKIRALALFRWTDVAEGEWNFGIENRQGVIDDWRDAMGNDYRWASAITETLQEAKWHLISLPRDPADPNPAATFAGITVNGRLHRWDAASKSYVTYLSPNPSAFGDCETGAGYWLRVDAPATITYYGVDYTLDQHLPLATSGWHLIGHPFTGARALNQCSIRNGAGVTKSVLQARAEGWIELPMYEYDSSNGSYRRCGFDPWDSTQALSPWRGYWLRTIAAGLTLIIPAP